MNRIILGFLLSLFFLNINFGQDLQEGQKRWSDENRLTLDDFKIKISDDNNDAVYSQFMISHAVNGFDFMKRNLNQRIENIFIGNASWIDTSKVAIIKQQIKFQQMQFDLSEIEARKFRKLLLQNKKKITKGSTIVNKISNDVISEFSKIRMQFVKETEGGRNKEKLKEWEIQIASKLKELDDFRFENKKKIKLK